MESQYTILEANIFNISIEKELEEFGLPWYVIIYENIFMDTKINGIIMQGKIEKPMYLYKYRLVGNKSSLAKFVPLEIMKDSKSTDVKILKQEPGIIELAILSKIYTKKYIIMHSSKVDPKLIIERFSKPTIYRHDNSRDSR